MIERYARPRMKHVWSDENKYDHWLRIELAVCESWARRGIISSDDMASLKVAGYDEERLKELLVKTRHDMTAFLGSVTESLGDEGRWLHHGLTTSDVWDTATSLQLMDSADLLDKEVDSLLKAIREKALIHRHTLMMGRTHGVHAEPITFGLKLALWLDEMRRNKQRLAQAKNVISVGKISGPVGTHATVPPSVEAEVCEILGLRAAPVSNQIIQRDRHAQFLTTLALIASSLEKFATEIRGLQRTEIREVEEPFGEGQTGSSSMPHKRNPELCERICGLARLIRGQALTALENVALWGERDISHSSAERIIFPDSCMALDYMISLFVTVIEGLHVHQDRMLHNMESTRGLLFSQRAMLTLVEKGMRREQAYKLVQTISMKTWDEGHDFRELFSADTEVSALLSPQEIENLFNYQYYIRYVDEVFNKVGLS